MVALRADAFAVKPTILGQVERDFPKGRAGPSLTRAAICPWSNGVLFWVLRPQRFRYHGSTKQRFDHQAIELAQSGTHRLSTYPASMAFSDSYLGRIRQKIGSDLVLMPGAMVALRNPDGRVLLTRRADDGTWCLPAGAAEQGSSFARTAVDELKEEVGITVAESDLVPFGCLSEAELHTINYPNGDVTHCFALLFIAERWTGEPQPDGEEATSSRFAHPSDPPAPLHEPTEHALELLIAFQNSNRFQIR